jgi:hypothetical protein
MPNQETELSHGLPRAGETFRLSLESEAKLWIGCFDTFSSRELVPISPDNALIGGLDSAPPFLTLRRSVKIRFESTLNYAMFPA